MTQEKKSKLAFGVFAATAVVTLGATAFSSTFAATETATGEVEVVVSEVLTIELSNDNVLLEANAAINEGLAQNNTQVAVGTNSVNGASLTVQMDSATPSNSLNGDTSGNTAQIAPTAGAVLGANQWGYEAFNSGSSASGIWNAMPIYGSPTVIFSNFDTGAGMDQAGVATWTFEFGAKIDFTLPADTYRGTILYTATTN
jgi:hypothetical protein